MIDITNCYHLESNNLEGQLLKKSAKRKIAENLERVLVPQSSDDSHDPLLRDLLRATKPVLEHEQMGVELRYVLEAVFPHMCQCSNLHPMVLAR